MNQNRHALPPAGTHQRSPEPSLAASRKSCIPPGAPPMRKRDALAMAAKDDLRNWALRRIKLVKRILKRLAGQTQSP